MTSCVDIQDERIPAEDDSDVGIGPAFPEHPDVQLARLPCLPVLPGDERLLSAGLTRDDVIPEGLEFQCCCQ